MRAFCIHSTDKIKYRAIFGVSQRIRALCIVSIQKMPPHHSKFHVVSSTSDVMTQQETINRVMTTTTTTETRTRIATKNTTVVVVGLRHGRRRRRTCKPNMFFVLAVVVR